ncbi:MAG TPA: carboxypeptidase-like regulatory domain-containing protein, partial [Vicinamibacterales bacterium]|nr:carboxypeptidase-like regulatory domain-containing protein [Vicinamibacterales bacterium]
MSRSGGTGRTGGIAWRVWIRKRVLLLLPFLAILPLPPVAAQSPNTARLVVLVSDQSGAVVPGATVAAVNSATSARREAVSGADGSATIGALPIAGSYVVTVSLSGFSTETIKDVSLDAGTTATIRVRLTVAGGSSSVTVYGAADNVHAEPELGQRFDAEQLDTLPVIGRKISAVPLLNAAFRPAKGTGDLFMNSVYVVTGAGGRREANFVVDGASADEPWGRQTMFSTLPIGAVQEMNVMSRAFSAEFGWTSSAAVNIVTRSGSNQTRGEALFLGRPGALQPTAMSGDLQCAESAASCVAPTTNGTPSALVPPDIPDSLAQGSMAIGGPVSKDRTQFFASADLTRQDRTAAITTPLVTTGTTIVGNYRQALLDARGDHRINPANSVMARVNIDRFYDTNPQDAVSGTVLPSAGRQFTRHSWTAQVNETAVISSSMLNEARFELQDADP